MNDQKPTCGPLFLECIKQFTESSSQTQYENLLRTFSAGHMVGQAEKIYLGVCSGAMFRPSPEYREWVLVAAIKISTIYGLEVSVFEREEIKDEIWIHTRGCRKYLANLRSVDVNSSEWHFIRGRVCGVPAQKIDSKFHLRKGYNQPCDRAGDTT